MTQHRPSLCRYLGSEVLVLVYMLRAAGLAWHCLVAWTMGPEYELTTTGESVLPAARKYVSRNARDFCLMLY